MLVEIYAKIRPWPIHDTGSPRARVEHELSLLQPGAAYRYATIRSLAARTFELFGFGWARMNPEMVCGRRA